jgi:hypothetical protein
MDERWDRNLEGEITAKMHEVLGCMCMVAMPDGERRGIIDSIVPSQNDFNESFPLPRFQVLTSTEVVHCYGSEFRALRKLRCPSQTA